MIKRTWRADSQGNQVEHTFNLETGEVNTGLIMGVAQPKFFDEYKTELSQEQRIKLGEKLKRLP